MEEKQPSFPEQVRAWLDDNHVEQRLTELAQHADELVRQGLAKAGEFAHEHREDVGRLLDRAADAVNGRTEGRHASSVEDVRGIVSRGVDKLAEHHQADGDPGTGDTGTRDTGTGDTGTGDADTGNGDTGNGDTGNGDLRDGGADGPASGR